MLKATRALFVLTAVTMASAALALPPLTKVFATTYPTVPKGSALAKGNCAICHVGMTAKLNPYGQAQSAAMKAKKSKALTPAILKAIENADSDKDGVKNIAEIKKGTLPGDPKSK